MPVFKSYGQFLCQISSHQCKGVDGAKGVEFGQYVCVEGDTRNRRLLAGVSCKGYRVFHKVV